MEHPHDPKPLTLKQMMLKLSKIAKNNIYKVVVRGKLSFSQDLIFSKIVPEVLDSKRIDYNKQDPSVSSLIGDFVLLRQEIINGVLTYNTWDIIKKVASTQELKEFNNLIVVSAIYWEDKKIKR